MVSVPMSVPVSVAGNLASTTLQAMAGVTSTIVPSNVQILNVNTMRPGTSVAGQEVGKQVATRVVIDQHMVGVRPSVPRITLQPLQGLQPGTQRYLLLKTENGQYQLLRVGSVPTTGIRGGTAVTSNSTAGSVVVAPTAGTTYRLASVPAVSRLNTQFTGPPLATLRKPIQTVATSVTTASTTPGTVTSVAAVTSVPATTKFQTVPIPVQRQTTDNTKEKCRKFLADLLKLSRQEPKSVEQNVWTLIQELIDTKVEPEEFCVRLAKLLNASPQPCLIGFLKNSLPLLRQSLVTKEFVIEGIRPPPAHVVFSLAEPTPVVQVQNQVRSTVAMAVTAPVAGAMTLVRVMTPLAGATTTIQRPAHPIQRPTHPVQQRQIGPVVTMVRSRTAQAMKTAVAVSGIRPTLSTIQKPPPTAIMKIPSEIVMQLRKRGIPVDETVSRDERCTQLVSIVKAEPAEANEQTQRAEVATAREHVTSSGDTHSGNTSGSIQERDNTQNSEIQHNIDREHQHSEDDMSDTKIFFRLETDDWELFTERLDLYLFARKISEADMKRAILLTHVDEETYKLLKNLCAPDKPTTKSYDDLIQLLTQYLKPAPSEVTARFLFNRAKQEQNETIADFAIRLRHLARDCNFAEKLNEALHDQFVCGIYDVSIRIELFKQSKLNFYSALKVATARESAMKNAQEVACTKKEI